MGMIRRADIEDYTRNATVMNLGDLQAQGKAVVQAASERAEQIIKEAQAQRDQMFSGAAEEGRQQGHREGFAKGSEEGRADGFTKALQEHNEQITALVEQWAATLNAFSKSRDSMYQQARRDVVELAAVIAQRVTKRTITLDPSIVETQMQSVLGSLAAPTGLVLRVNPEDLAYAETVLPGLIADCMNCAHAEVIGDESLARGSCIAETEGRGVIDASIGTQLDRIVDALIPHQQQGEQQADQEPDIQDDAA